ncbi:hypothetical protein EYW98_03750 [Escherichia coli]|nr:hypothetical protein [Escherichia coli]EGO8377329.1 hypothetical protein [Escherichia coli]
MQRERLIRPTKTCNFNRLQRLRRPDKRSASGNFAFVIILSLLLEAQIVDNVRFVHAGCGVNALSGLQNMQFQ